jgi:hypothetical protein
MQVQFFDFTFIVCLKRVIELLEVSSKYSTVDTDKHSRRLIVALLNVIMY